MTRIKIPFNLSFLDYPENTHCISVYFIGCDNKCPDCHNSELQKPDYDIWTNLFDVESLQDKLFDESERYRTTKISLMGGDPLYKDNIDITKEFLESNVFYDVCLYTGYDVEFVKLNEITGFKYLKTGRFEKSLYVEPEKTDKYFQLASTNQCLYDKDFNLISNNGRFYYK